MNIQKDNPAADVAAAAVVSSVRESFVHQGPQQTVTVIFNTSAAKNDSVSLEKNKAELDVLVAEMMNHMTIPAEAVPSPQPLLGIVKTFFKSVLLRISRPFLCMAFSEQIEWNQNTYEAVKRLHQSTEQLRQEIDVLNKKIDAYRLKKEDDPPRA